MRPAEEYAVGKHLRCCQARDLANGPAAGATGIVFHTTHTFCQLVLRSRALYWDEKKGQKSDIVEGQKMD